ncbi:hypothetical protein GUJ93_ZPchr0001g31217 [Zizania palustris]|uniref:Protein ENHANCED DISEASE RESISTANCE 2 C-terminal domain-containing protein n=1 Tax=Zizania palustris TaxID=103762 RepID=A0A8J5V9Z4_ZIZPA|nr:hypothetical protein GUJ93_ZPchr0001g31217 [Zizania palustris]
MDWLLRPAGVDWLRNHSWLDHVLAGDDNRVATAFRRACLQKDSSVHFLLAVNLHVPGRPDGYSVVFYFPSRRTRCSSTSSTTMMRTAMPASRS